MRLPLGLNLRFSRRPTSCYHCFGLNSRWPMLSCSHRSASSSCQLQCSRPVRFRCFQLLIQHLPFNCFGRLSAAHCSCRPSYSSSDRGSRRRGLFKPSWFGCCVCCCKSCYCVNCSYVSYYCASCCCVSYCCASYCCASCYDVNCCCASCYDVNCCCASYYCARLCTTADSLILWRILAARLNLDQCG